MNQIRSVGEASGMVDANSLWNNVLSQLKKAVNDRVFVLWFAPIKLIDLGSDEITLGVNTDFQRCWTVDHHLDDIREALNACGYGAHRLKWVVTGGAEPEPEPEPEPEILSTNDLPDVPAKSSDLSVVGSLCLHAPVGDTTLVAIPMVRHFLFAPDKTKLRVRRYNVEAKHNGKRLVQSFRIGDTHAAPGKGYGVLTVKHQRALFAFQELWQQQGGQMVNWQGTRLGLVSASSYQLETKILGSRGGRQKTIVRQIIQELVSIPVAIDNYIDADGEITNVDVTGLLAGAHFNEPGKGKTKNGWVKIVLGSLLTRAFELSNLKPLALNVLDTLPDVPALLYPKLDYMLYRRAEVIWRLPTLVQNLGLIGEIAHQPNRRRRLFSAAAKNLDGKPLSKAGYCLSVRVAKGAAADGEDLLVASAAARPDLTLS